MTNGEMMQKIFPDMEIEIGEIDAYVWINHEPSHFDKTWWNAEYKEPNYSEIPTGSTTKNDLVPRKVVERIIKSPRTQEQMLSVLNSIPSVTPQEPRWIPVSERLPKDKETVLVTFKHHISGKTIGLGSVVVLRGKPHWHVREQNLGTYDVIAWMPLPKPFGEVEE